MIGDESYSRDGIDCVVEHRSLYAEFHEDGIRLTIFASMPENRDDLPSVARELVNRVDRIRDVLRSMAV